MVSKKQRLLRERCIDFKSMTMIVKTQADHF
jgi:hypothetical protein